MIDRIAVTTIKTVVALATPLVNIILYFYILKYGWDIKEGELELVVLFFELWERVWEPRKGGHFAQVST